MNTRFRLVAALILLIAFGAVAVSIPAGLLEAQDSPQLQAGGTGPANIYFTSNPTVSVGQQFDVIVEINTGINPSTLLPQLIDAAEVHFNFDITKLEVISTTVGTTLTLPLQNTFSNVAGTVDYAAGILSPYASGTFTLLTVRFEALEPAPAGTLLDLISVAFPRETNAIFGGSSVLNTITDGTVTITNAAPNANNDSTGTIEDFGLINISVLGNDTDPDPGQTLTITAVTNPPNGTVGINGGTSIDYTPDLNFNGVDTFDYTISDGFGGTDTATVTVTVLAVNDDPTVVDDAYTIDEDNTLSEPAPGVLGNDSDVDGDTLTVVVQSAPSNGTVNLGSNGAFTYNPDADFNGTDSFTYRASDPNGGIAFGTVTITVNAVNDPPFADDDSYTTDEDTPLTIPAPGVLGNDSDIETVLLIAALVGDVSSGTLTLNANGGFTYTPNADFNGSDSFTYEAFDGTDYSNTATVTITVNAVNDAPVAVDDSYSFDEDTVLNVAAIDGVLLNDADTEGDSLTTDLIAPPALGVLNLNPDGSFDYTPPADYSGTQTFTYRAFDGDYSNVATVTLDVLPVNDAPTVTDDGYSTNEDTPLTVPAPGVLSNDSDIDGDPLTVFEVTPPSDGTLTLNTDGSFTYTPDANFNGTDTFVYAADDSFSTTNATVTITVNAVNDAPTATADSYATNEDTPLNVPAPGVLGNDGDVDGNPLTAALVSNVSNGALTLNPNGSFSYTPNLNFNGSDSFTYQANDGTLNSNIVTVTITVNAVNDAPTAVNDSYSVQEGTTLTVAAPGLLGNDSDVDGNPLTVPLILPIAPFTGTGLAVNPNGGFTYTPAVPAGTTIQFTYYAFDGTALTPATVTINVVSNLPPDAVDDGPFTVAEDSGATVLDVRANDTDPTGDAFLVTSVTQPANGTVTITGGGTGVDFTPSANFNGTTTFTYTITDQVGGGIDTATVTVNVTAVNDAPTAAADGYATNEDTLLTVPAPGVLGNDGDVDGNPITASLVSNVSNGALNLNTDGSFTYTPNLNYVGSDSFTYQANDGALNSNIVTVTITVNAVNDAPVASPEGYITDEDTPLNVAAPGVLANDNDVDGNPLTAAVVTNPANGVLVLNTDGSFTYTPNLNFNGSDSFTYQANDGALNSNTVTVSITVNPINDSPVPNGDTYATNEDTPLNVAAPGVLSNDTDPDGDTLTAILDSNPANGTVTLNANGSFTYTPNLNFSGSDSFTYHPTDGVDEPASVTVTINVNPVNDPPVATADGYATNEDTPLNIAAPGVLGNDTDAESSPLTASLVSDVSNGTLTLNADGSFTYTPDANFSGSDSFTYQANDGTTNSNVATVTITVNGVNDAPNAVDDSGTTLEDNNTFIDLLGNDTDVDGDTLTIVGGTQPSHGIASFNAMGYDVIYQPAVNFNGIDTFTYTISDGHGGSDTATVTVTVNPVNDAPTAVADGYATNEDTPLNIAAPGVLGNDTDPEASPLTAAIVANASNGTVTLNADGSFSYTPNANFSGSDSFTYQANDGTLNSAAATVTITVNAVNDAPTATDDSYTASENLALNIAAPGVLGNDTDADGNPLTAAVVTNPTNGTVTLNANGSFTYTPNTDYIGGDSFTYQANDGTTNSNTATVSLNVVENQPPTVVNDSITTNEDTAGSIDPRGNDSDTEGNPFTVTGATNGANGVVTFTASSVTYTPNLNFNGADSFTYTVTDSAGGSSVGTVNVTVNAVNDAPNAVDDPASTPEDTAVTIPVLGNDTDPDVGQTLTITGVTQPANGVVTFTAGDVTYTPSANFSGVNTFTYTISDGNGGTDTATVTVIVNSVNDVPNAVDDTAATSEDTATTILVLSNDTDADGDTLTITAVTQGANGTVTFTAGDVTYTPNTNFSGTDTFTYTISDGNGGTDTATVNITVSGVNDPPTANDDTATTNEDTPVAIDVRANDTDADVGQTLSVIGVTQGGFGSVTITGGGTGVTYTPALNQSGTDTFSYTISDGNGGTDTAVVTVTVNAVNDAPTAANDNYSTAFETAITVGAPGVLANDSDVEGSPLTAVIVTNPANGAVTLNANGGFTYTPNAGFTGADTFTYTANDGSTNSNAATVRITVGAPPQPPTAAGDTYNPILNTPLIVNAPGVLGNDTDPEGDTLTAVLVTDVTNGTLTLNLNGGFTYTPALDFLGVDSFTYQASDGVRLSNIVTVTLLVTETPIPPPSGDAIYPTPTPLDTLHSTYNFAILDVVLGGVPEPLRYGVFGRLLVRDGQLFAEYNYGAIGNQGLVDQGIIQAMDIFAVPEITSFAPGITICMKGQGTLYYMAASGTPRVPVPLATTGYEGGYTCGVIYAPGTVVLTGAGASASSTPGAPVLTEYSSCTLRAEYRLNMRAEASLGSPVIELIPYMAEIQATGRQGEWYRVAYNGQTGWVSADYVSPLGLCQ